MINVAIDSYIRVSGLPKPSFDAVIKRLTYPNPTFLNALKYGQGGARWIPRTIKSYRYEHGELWLPRGYLMEFLSEIVANSGSPYQIANLLNKNVIESPETIIGLRSYQEKMIQELLLYPGVSCILQSPPGTGKTLTGLAFAKKLSRKTLWITHTKDLANQTIHAASNQATIKSLDLPKSEIGMIGQGKFKVGDFLTIAMVQTLHRRTDKLKELKNEFGTIVIDEVHHSPATSWHLASHLFAPGTTLGLTATSYRNDGLTQMMYDCVGPVVTRADKRMLVKEGVLVIPTVYMVNTGIVLPGINYSTLLSDMVEHNGRNKVLMDIIRYIRRDPNNTLMVLSARRKHVELLTQMCQEEGLEPLMMLGDMSNIERTLAAEKVKSKSTRLIIATYKLLSEGFDYPCTNFVIFATPFKDSVLIEQCVGRAQRISVGKEFAFILDPMDINPVLRKQAKIRYSVYQGLDMDAYSVNAQEFIDRYLH